MAYTSTKTFRQLKPNIDYENRMKMTKSIKEVIIYGHSLNKQDYSYFQSIFDYLDIYNEDITLKFMYSVGHFEEPKYINAQEDMADRVTTLLTDYGNTLDNKDHGKNLLHKLIVEGRLIFDII